MRRRLLGLAAGESVSLILFLYISFILDFGIAGLVAVAYLAFILCQGSLYWLYRYHLLRRNRRPGSTAIAVLRIMRVLNLLVFLFAIAGLAIFNAGILDLIASVVILVFGLIEYVNYYWYRLSYGKSGFNVKLLLLTGFRESSISKTITSQQEQRHIAY